MVNRLDQQIPNRLPRKLGAQLVIALTLLTICIAPVPIALIFRPFDFNVLCFGVVGSLIGPLRIYFAQAGYQIGYDDTRLYQRKWGWNWRTLQRFPVHSMRYDEIASMRGRFIDRDALKRNFFPFDYIELRSLDDHVPDIEIYPIYLEHPQDKDLLEEIYARRHEIFPENVLSYMRGAREM
jgi:hypothetical protein